MVEFGGTVLGSTENTMSTRLKNGLTRVIFRIERLEEIETRDEHITEEA